MDLVDHLRVHARANRLANLRLHEAMRELADEQFGAARTGFFPSLARTLDHILAVDLYYVAALRDDADPVGACRAFVPSPTLAALAPRQAASDARLIAFCDTLDAAAAAAPVALPRGDHVQRDRVANVLWHLFMHQTHHRGQAHAMLSGTPVAPPQLDEFLMPSEGHLRAPEMDSLGWSEDAVYGPVR